MTQPIAQSANFGPRYGWTQIGGLRAELLGRLTYDQQGVLHSEERLLVGSEISTGHALGKALNAGDVVGDVLKALDGSLEGKNGLLLHVSLDARTKSALFDQVHGMAEKRGDLVLNADYVKERELATGVEAGQQVHV